MDDLPITVYQINGFSELNPFTEVEFTHSYRNIEHYRERGIDGYVSGFTKYVSMFRRARMRKEAPVITKCMERFFIFVSFFSRPMPHNASSPGRAVDHIAFETEITEIRHTGRGLFGEHGMRGRVDVRGVQWKRDAIQNPN